MPQRMSRACLLAGPARHFRQGESSPQDPLDVQSIEIFRPLVTKRLAIPAILSSLVAGCFRFSVGELRAGAGIERSTQARAFVLAQTGKILGEHIAAGGLWISLCFSPPRKSACEAST